MKLLIQIEDNYSFHFKKVLSPPNFENVSVALKLWMVCVFEVVTILAIFANFNYICKFQLSRDFLEELVL